MLNLSKKIMYLIIFSIIVMIIACTPVSAKHLEIDSIQPNDNGGTAETTFTVAEKTTNNPQTGDNIMFYIIMLGLSIIGLAGTGFYIRKKRYN